MQQNHIEVFDNTMTDFHQIQQQLYSNAFSTICKSKIGNEFIHEAIDTSDYLFVNYTHTQIIGFAAINFYIDDDNKQYFYINLICNNPSITLYNFPAFGGAVMLDKIEEMAKQEKCSYIKLNAVEDVITYYHKFGYDFVNAKLSNYIKNGQDNIIHELYNAYKNNNKTMIDKLTKKIVQRYYPGYFTEKTQSALGSVENTRRIEDQLDTGIPMIKYLINEPSGKGIKRKHGGGAYKKTKKNKMNKKSKQIKSKSKSKQIKSKKIKSKSKSKSKQNRTKKRNSILKMQCAPGKKLPLNDQSQYTCLSTNELNTLKNMWNIRHRDSPITSTSTSQIWNDLAINMKMICNKETCWMKQKFVRGKMDNVLEHSYAPNSPYSWKENPNTWLNSIDITNVMKQYESQYRCFNFIGPAPIDFDTYKVNNNIVWDELGNFDLQKEINNNHFKIGIIFNLDEHYKSGSHWVSMYINIKQNYIYYFDSVGEKIPPKIKALADRIIKQGKQLSEPIYFKFDQNYPVEHQYGNTECGMYSLYFIIHLLEDTHTKDYFKTHILKDKDVEKFRKIYFNHHKD